MTRSQRLTGVLAAFGAFALCGASSFGVIIDGNGSASDPGLGGNNTSVASFPVSGMKNVGTFAGGSGVYIGNGWVLAAYHEATTQFGTPGSKTLSLNDGTTTTNYANDGLYHRLTTGPTPADLVMVHLSTIPNAATYPALTISTATPTVGTKIYSLGDGLTRGAATTYNGAQGYLEVSPQVNRWGQTTTASNSTPSVGGPGGPTISLDDGNGTTSLFLSVFGTGTTQISSGDSGGGVFGTDNTLLGVNILAVTNDMNQPNNEAIFGNASGYANLAGYQNQIASFYSTPEPATLGMLAVAAAPVLLRRRRPLQ